MEQKQISSVSDGLPPLSAKFPWLVAQGLEEDNTGVQIFYTMHDPLSHYRCQIPELVGRRIRGCFHGWVILSRSYPDNIIWSLWNPVTSKTIRLPPLILKDGENYDAIKYCCLASPPDDPSSILLLTRTKTPNIVFCRLNRKRKRLRWTEMTYARQLRSITSCDDGFLHCLTCCNGKVYALNSGNCYGRFVIQVDINVVNDTQVVISLLPFGMLPFPFYNGCYTMKGFLKGYCTQLFYIKVGFNKTAKNTLGAVYLFKLDMTTGMIWQEMEDLNHALLFLDLAHDSIYYRPAIASELGGYIHIRGHGTLDKVIYSYDIKHRTISLSCMPCLALRSYVSLWECRLQGDHREIKCRADFKPNDDKKEGEIVVRDDETTSTRNEPAHEENIVSHLLNIPFDVLEMIMEFCLGVEYLNFRATCKYCRLAAPVIRWSNETTLRRLQTYSLVSPWLIVLDNYRGVITFTDPMFGDKYFIKTPREFIGDWHIYCSGYGWLLMFKIEDRPEELLFFNPFTNDILELPYAPGLDSLSFTAPPTSPDCMIFGFSASLPWHIFIFRTQTSWRILPVDFGATIPNFVSFPSFYDGDIHALHDGSLGAFREMGEGAYIWDVIVAEAPCSNSSAQYFLVKCDQHLLLVIVDEFGEFVEVFKLNHSRKEWEKMDGLGKHMIYICGRTCLCLEAKTPEMENKVYFPRLHSENGKIVFYCFETCMYHTFNDRNIELDLGDFIDTKYHHFPHAWIEPSWS